MASIAATVRATELVDAWLWRNGLSIGATDEMIALLPEDRVDLIDAFAAALDEENE